MPLALLSPKALCTGSAGSVKGRERDLYVAYAGKETIVHYTTTFIYIYTYRKQTKKNIITHGLEGRKAAIAAKLCLALGILETPRLRQGLRAGHWPVTNEGSQGSVGLCFNFPSPAYTNPWLRNKNANRAQVDMGINLGTVKERQNGEQELPKELVIGSKRNLIEITNMRVRQQQRSSLQTRQTKTNI